MRVREFVKQAATVIYRGEEGTALNHFRYLNEAGTIEPAGKNRFGRDVTATDAAILMIASAHNGRAADIADWVKKVGEAEAMISHRVVASHASLETGQCDLSPYGEIGFSTFGLLPVLDGLACKREEDGEEYKTLSLIQFVSALISFASTKDLDLPDDYRWAVEIRQQFPSAEFKVEKITRATSFLGEREDDLTIKFLLKSVDAASDSSFRQDVVRFRANAFKALSRLLHEGGDD